MTEQFLFDDEIHEYLETCSSSSLRFALEEAISEYLLGDYGAEFDPEKYRIRRNPYRQGYHPYIIYAYARPLPLWKKWVAAPCNGSTGLSN